MVIFRCPLASLLFSLCTLAICISSCKWIILCIFLLFFSHQKNEMIWCSLFIFAFVFIAWGYKSKNILLRLKSKHVLLIFSPTSYIVSGPTCWFLTQFEVFFVYGIKMFLFYFLHVAVQLSQHYLLSFLCCVLCYPCLRLLDHLHLILFLGSLFCSLTYVSNFVIVHEYFEECSIV